MSAAPPVGVQRLSRRFSAVYEECGEEGRRGVVPGFREVPGLSYVQLRFGGWRCVFMGRRSSTLPGPLGFRLRLGIGGALDGLDHAPLRRRAFARWPAH